MRTHHGFSLIEMAVALVVVGLLLGAFALPLTSQHERLARRQTEALLHDVREALIGYAALRGHLPCPDSSTDPAHDDYGLPDTSCATGNEGFLPHRALGLTAQDAWGNRLRYRVDPAFTAPLTLSTQPHFTRGELRVGVLHEEKKQSTQQEPPVALFFSFGPNGKPDDGNTTHDYRADLPTPEFDDQLAWISRPLLYARLLTLGGLPANDVAP
ncbi:MAG: prepilin-type N-terminal cleavage/methylation domain-containing protein [Zoogloeaceae bacterium]|jgi:prepilin-type N-terminal cleavage/methylation domain-containing protein|nr:prepilin-type N-terminal cleavage/methylation domain-containing protein [Zoogloeaceae bacterium]